MESLFFCVVACFCLKHAEAVLDVPQIVLMLLVYKEGFLSFPVVSFWPHLKQLPLMYQDKINLSVQGKGWGSCPPAWIQHLSSPVTLCIGASSSQGRNHNSHFLSAWNTGKDGREGIYSPAPQHVMHQMHKSFPEVLHWVQLMVGCSLQMVSHGADLEEVGGRTSWHFGPDSLSLLFMVNTK